MFKDINEHMKLSREDRQNHLDLNEPCLEIGGYSTQFKGVLSHFLKLTIPKNHKILLLHACYNGNCSNPKHMYYGTHHENVLDEKAAGTYKSIWEKMVEKYGEEEARRRQGQGRDQASGGKANKGKKKSEEHRRKISEAMKNAIVCVSRSTGLYSIRKESYLFWTGEETNDWVDEKYADQIWETPDRDLAYSILKKMKKNKK